jgi:mevalonate kinase
MSRVSDAKKIFRKIGDALEQLPEMNQTDKTATVEALIKINEELGDAIIKIIQDGRAYAESLGAIGRINPSGKAPLED